MKRKILIGTRNQHKLDRFKALLSSLNLDLYCLTDFKIDVVSDEDELKPVENALKKAKFYFALAKIPTLSIDYGLYIDKFPKNLQPGLNVRRINNKKDVEVSDDELLDYYTKMLGKYADGESEGIWITGIALVVSEDEVYTSEYESKTKLTEKRSKMLTPGEPLNSIQMLPSGKYKSEISAEEKAQNKSETDKLIYDFLKLHLI